MSETNTSLLTELDKLTVEKDQFKVEAEKANLKLVELETDLNNYRSEVQTLQQSASSNLNVIIDRDSLKERLEESHGNLFMYLFKKIVMGHNENLPLS